MKVLDASAVLAFLQGEAGADVVESALTEGAAIGAANWSEVLQKVAARGADVTLVTALVDSYGVEIAPVTPADAERAAALWTRGSGLSLADRLCVALGDRLDATVLTADKDWGSRERIRQIR